MPNYANERLGALIQREIVSIINNIIKNEKWGYINIVAVKVTKDMSFATIYYTILNDDEKTITKAKESINNHKIVIRKELAAKIKNNVRKIPELIFKYDESLSYGNHIEKILKEINKK